MIKKNILLFTIVAFSSFGKAGFQEGSLVSFLSRAWSSNVVSSSSIGTICTGVAFCCGMGPLALVVGAAGALAFDSHRAIHRATNTMRESNEKLLAANRLRATTAETRDTTNSLLGCAQDQARRTNNLLDSTLKTMAETKTVQDDTIVKFGVLNQQVRTLSDTAALSAKKAVKLEEAGDKLGTEFSKEREARYQSDERILVGYASIISQIAGLSTRVEGLREEVSQAAERNKEVTASMADLRAKVGSLGETVTGLEKSATDANKMALQVEAGAVQVAEEISALVKRNASSKDGQPKFNLPPKGLLTTMFERSSRASLVTASKRPPLPPSPRSLSAGISE